MKKENPFLQGMRDGSPIAMGYFAVAFSLGIVAARAGLSAGEGFLCSLFTRASAGEYGAYSLIAASATCLELAVMCVVTNLRYLLMGASLTQKFAPETPLWMRMAVACCITDEIFGITIARQGDLKPAYPFGATVMAGTLWAAGTACGILAGAALPVSLVSALSVALYGMFLAIIIPPARRNKALLAAVAVSFFLSWLCGVLPGISGISAGYRTILLTLLISAAMALIKPVSVEKGSYGPVGTLSDDQKS